MCRRAPTREDGFSGRARKARDRIGCERHVADHLPRDPFAIRSGIGGPGAVQCGGCAGTQSVEQGSRAEQHHRANGQRDEHLDEREAGPVLAPHGRAAVATGRYSVVRSSVDVPFESLSVTE
jgi:hypothetical protein